MILRSPSRGQTTESAELCEVKGLSLHFENAVWPGVSWAECASENEGARRAVSISGALGGRKLRDPFKKVDGTRITQKVDWV
jgi:hypothetical protein